MFQRVASLGVGAAVTLAAACAQRYAPAAGESRAPGPDRIYSRSHLTTLPEFRGCADYSDPARPSQYDRTTVQFVIAPDGTVEPNGVMAAPGHHDVTDPAVLEWATDVARTCRYDAGRIDGTPVRVRWSKRFVIR